MGKLVSMSDAQVRRYRMRRREWNQFNQGLMILCSAIAYLMNTRNEREEGNELAPENELYWAMERLVKGN